MLLAIDAGTGSARAVLFAPDGTEVAAAQEVAGCADGYEDACYAGDGDACDAAAGER